MLILQIAAGVFLGMFIRDFTGGLNKGNPEAQWGTKLGIALVIVICVWILFSLL